MHEIQIYFCTILTFGVLDPICNLRIVLLSIKLVWSAHRGICDLPIVSILLLDRMLLLIVHTWT